MDCHTVRPDTKLAFVIDADRWGREKAEEFIKSINPI
jgi:hypothetical protein